MATRLVESVGTHDNDSERNKNNKKKQAVISRIKHHSPHPVPEEQQQPPDLPPAEPRRDDADRDQGAQHPGHAQHILSNLQTGVEEICRALTHSSSMLLQKHDVSRLPGSPLPSLLFGS